MIQFGDAESIAELKKLWKTCFFDEDAYINSFFHTFYESGNVLLTRENGMLMGASFFLPGKLYRQNAMEQGSWQNIRYVYALAVYPQFRGRGIAGDLLRTAFQIYHHTPLIAEPAEEGLIDGFYEPLGFVPSFYLKKEQIREPQISLRAAQIQPYREQKEEFRQLDEMHIQICPVQTADYCRIRDLHFQKEGYISWPSRHIAFALQEHRSYGGEALLVSENGREDLLLYMIEDGQVMITETTLPQDQALRSIDRWLKGAYDTVVYTSAASISEKSETTKDSGLSLIGMSYGMPPVYGYLNLSLD